MKLKIAFILEEFAVPSPGQQLLDRFLGGYARDGEFHKPDCEVTLALAAEPDEKGREALKNRSQAFGLKVVPDVAAALAGANSMVVVWRGGGAVPNEGLLEKVLSNAGPGSRCFVHGLLAQTEARAKELAELARGRQVSLDARTSIGSTFRLPQMEMPDGMGIQEALIVVQGPFPQGEFDGLEGLFPLLEHSVGKKIARLSLKSFAYREGSLQNWRGDKQLLAAAISRSSTIQGDPLKDGRTQDIVGLGLLEKLAPTPRVWWINHKAGVTTSIIVLDGALEDYNFALKLSSGKIVSSQLYRPPLPAQEQFSPLASLIEDYLAGGLPAGTERAITIASLMQALRKNG